MKRARQEKIFQIIASKRIATQQELADELQRRGIASTQSSVSRDIVEMGLVKINGHYAAPQPALNREGPLVDIDTAGDNLIVVRTETGQAQPVALAIDRAKIEEVVGTLAGDDTILVAVKNPEAQRAAMKKIVKLFAAPAAKTKSGAVRTRTIARSLFFL